jgi:hypothetical protein
MAEEVIYYRFRCRRDTAANLAAVNETPLEGEWCFEIDTGLAKIGDGGTPYNDIPYYDAVFHCDATGTNDLTVALPVALQLYDKILLHVRASAANTGAATFNTLPITKHGGAALVAGDIAGAGHDLLLVYAEAAARWELLNPAVTNSTSTPALMFSRISMRI